MSCALCPPNYMSPSFKVTSKRVSSQQTQGGAKILAVPWFAGDWAVLLPGCRGWGEGEGKQKPKVKEKTTGSQVSNETCLLAPLWAVGCAAASGSHLAGPMALRPGHLLLPHNRSKVPSGLRAAL